MGGAVLRVATDFFFAPDFACVEVDFAGGAFGPGVAADFAGGAFVPVAPVVFRSGAFEPETTAGFPGVAFEVDGEVDFFLGVGVTPVVGAVSASASRSAAANNKRRIFFERPLCKFSTPEKASEGAGPQIRRYVPNYWLFGIVPAG